MAGVAPRRIINVANWRETSAPAQDGQAGASSRRSVVRWAMNVCSQARHAYSYIGMASFLLTPETYHPLAAASTGRRRTGARQSFAEGSRVRSGVRDQGW